MSACGPVADMPVGALDVRFGVDRTWQTPTVISGFDPNVDFGVASYCLSQHHAEARPTEAARWPPRMDPLSGTIANQPRRMIESKGVSKRTTGGLLSQCFQKLRKV